MSKNSKKTASLTQVLVVGMMLLLIGVGSVNGQRYAVANGNWNAAIWASTANGLAGSATVPTSSDDVFINDNRSVTVNLAASCNSLTISDGTNAASVVISGTNTLTVTNAIIIGNGTGNGDNKFINVGTGALSCGSISMDNSGGNNWDCYVSISTGTVSVSGNITMNGTNARNQIVFAGAGFLNVGGAISGGTISNASGGYTTLNRGTVNYNGANQTVGSYNYFNLTLSGSGTKTMQAGTTAIAGSLVLTGTASATLVANLAVAGNTNIGTGTTLDLSTFNANRTTAGGTLAVAGTLMLGGTSGGQTGSNFPANYSTITLTGGIVNYDNAAGGQIIYAVPAYTTLTLGNTSGTQTAGGNLTATTLNNNTNAADILNMATYTLNATTVNNSGTIRTQNISGAPIPAGRTWGGTISYDATTGNQTVVAGTYTTLTLGNTSGTQTAGGNLTATTLNNNANATSILNLAVYTLAATTVNNSGTIRTQNTSATPIPVGRIWGGTINYDAASGSQTIVAGTYTTLTLGNTSGTQAAGGNLTVTTLNNNTNAADILNMGIYTLGVTTVNNTGTIRTQNTSASPISSGKTWGGTVLFDGTTGTQTIPASTFNSLSINNNGGAALSGAVAVSGVLTLTNGKLTTTNANLLSVTNTATAAISGGSTTAYINGPVRWTLPASLASGSTYNFPVGKATYLPFSLVNPTTGTGAVTAQVEAFNTGSGGAYDATLYGISTSEYWSLATVGNFTNSSVSLIRQTAISPLNVIAGSTTVAGTYSSLSGSAGTYGITASNSIASNRFFVLGQSAPAITISSATLSGFTYPQGTGPSSQQSFTVSGSFLTNNIVVTPPTNYEISTTSGSGFQSTALSLPVSNGTVSTTTIYVRLISGLSLGTYSNEVILLTSSGAVEKTVTCSGSVTTAPAVVATPSSRTGFVYTYNSSTTTSQSFAVSGTNLVGNVIVTPPSDYEISTGTTYQSTPITLTPTGGTLSSTTINVRMKLGLGVGSHIQNVVVSSTGAISQNVLCSGTVNPAPTIYNDNSILSGFVYATGAGPSGVQTFKVNGTNLTAPIILTPQANYEISLSAGSGYISTTTTPTYLSISPSGGTVNPTTIYVRLKAGLAVNSYNLVSIVLTSTGAITKSVSCSGSVVSGATLTTSKTTLTAFGYLYGNGPSSEQSFSVSGAALGTNNLTVTPSASYQISTGSGASFVPASTITLAPSGGKVTPTIIYVRLKAGLGTVGVTQTFGPENILVAASGATSINVACSGKVFASPLISASATGTPSCPNSSITLLSTGADIQTRYWQGPNNFYSTDQNPVLATNNSTPEMTGTYTVTGNVVVGGNLITNGDFESGNTSFGSGYGYVTPSATALQPEALYTIVASPQSVHGSFTTNGDHTAAPGTLQMVVNGSPTAGVVVWSQSVPVIPGATYQFTYWEQTVCMPAPSMLQLYVNGVSAGPVYTASSTIPAWTQFLYNAAAGTNTVLNLELVNQNTIANGNDFALDDIVFQQILSANSSVDVLVSSSLPANVSIVATATNVAQGATVSYTATPTNGGDSPIYQWKVNGGNVGTNSSTFSYVPSNGEVVTCTMTSSLACGNTVTSNSITMTVLQPVNYWRGTNSTDWGTASNWTAGYVPAPGENVIYASITNGYGSNAINDLVLDQNRTIGSFINATTKRLVIPAAKGLTVNNTITTDNNPDRIYIHCDSLTSNGSLIFHNSTSAPVYATVEMYSKASWNLNNPTTSDKYFWQYFGIPIQSVVAQPTFNGSYVRKWDEKGTAINNHWVQLDNSSVLVPFYGYELCQVKPKVIYFKGKLVNSDFNSGQMAFTYYGAGDARNALFPGQHIFANPYTSAIDIRQLVFGSQTEATVYMYNTGTYKNWTNGGQTSTGENPGQYTSSTKNLAGYGGIPRQVPAMGAMLVKAMSNSSQATFGITYNSVAMLNTDLQRVSSSIENSSDKVCSRIDVRSSNGGDRMWIFSENNCTRSFDNGWDGVKILGSSLSPQLYALEPDGNYQVNVVDDMNNTELAFQSGSDVEYTLTFTHQNISRYYPGVYLVDKVENRIVDVTENGSQYSFLAVSTPNPVNRFQIVTRYYENASPDKDSAIKIFSSNGMIFVHNFSNHNGNALIFDISGHFVQKVQFTANGITILNSGLASGAYVAKCITESDEVTKRIIVR